MPYSSDSRPVLLALVCYCCVGCQVAPFYDDESPLAELPLVELPVVGGPLGFQNPFAVGRIDREFLWNQVVDTVDDYFQIAREQRVRYLDGVITEGRLDTFPLPGATHLEPWREDSTPGFELWHSTLQSTRRQATVRVTPVAEGYSIHVIVEKELEDLDRPAFSTPGSSIPRYDGTIVRIQDELSEEPVTLGWIKVGRDASLENTIIQQLRERLADGNPGPPPVF